jgi:hypothetical protein
MSAKMTHIYDWLDEPPAEMSAGEKFAREFLNEFTKPACEKNHAMLDATKLFCTYQGKRYRCTGASRMGDVWLTADFNRGTGYDLRIEVDGITEWSNAP